MNTLVWLGILLIALWIVAGLIFKVSGFLIHLLLIVGIVLLVWWAVGKLFRRERPRTP